MVINAFGMKYGASLMCVLFAIQSMFTILLVMFAIHVISTIPVIFSFLRMNKQNPKQRDYKIYRTKMLSIK